MKNVTRGRRPSAAMIVAVIALVMAMTGGAIAAGQIKLGALTDGAKNKTVGVGKLTYVQQSQVVPNPDPTGGTAITATCPSGLKVIGGGIKGEDPESDFIFDSYPTTAGWKGRVYAGGAATQTRTFVVTAICAPSRVVTGAPPSS
jgi:hypothetical protein